MIQRDMSEMSDYERKAWQALVEQAEAKGGQRGRNSKWTQGAKLRAKDAAAKARAAIGRVPGADQVLEAADAALAKAMEALHTALVERGLNSVKSATIFKTFEEEGVSVASYDDVRQLDLKVCDRSVPRRKERYIALAASQGAATSLAVTGATVSSTVTGGATFAVVATAISADVTAVMVGMGRIIALVAAHYGYDVREPEEQVFASGVLAYSSATGSAEKAASLASLSRLTQQMMRRATWKQLQQHQLVNVIQKVFTSLGFNLTQKKLAQAVPVVGVVVNTGLNARIVQKTFQRAQQAYRLRFLTEKYNLNPTDWAPDIVDVESTEVPLVDELIDDELAVEPPDDTSDCGEDLSD
ncbi:MAG: EcsC family protein [Mycobacterium sp.]|uniref:EcsC family protein n=1 Tax=Mycobacterium sp. TaxID=1785 RepID=UPI003F9D0847